MKVSVGFRLCNFQCVVLCSTAVPFEVIVPEGSKDRETMTFVVTDGRFGPVIIHVSFAILCGRARRERKQATRSSNQRQAPSSALRVKSPSYVLSDPAERLATRYAESGSTLLETASQPTKVQFAVTPEDELRASDGGGWNAYSNDLDEGGCQAECRQILLWPHRHPQHRRTRGRTGVPSCGADVGEPSTEDSPAHSTDKASQQQGMSSDVTVAAGT